MENIVSWVYISEDISTSTFLNGGELIITTGVTSGEREDWLRAFIKELIKRGTCGLILNTGRYIFEEDITDEIVRLCYRYSFPLLPCHGIQGYSISPTTTTTGYLKTPGMMAT